MVASLLFLAVSCQQEEIASVEPGTDVFEVYASIEDIDDEETRTYLSGNEVYWSSGDKIAVFYKNTLRKRFDVTPESIDSKNATFLLDEGYVQMGSNVNVSHNVAYYPFCEVTCAPDGSSYTLRNLTLPSTQSYVDGSVGLGAFPMVAVTENTDDVNFCFKNICGVMQFQLKGSGFVKSVSVRGNRGEVLAGSAVVTAGYGKEPSISMSTEGVKEVTLDCGESGVELNEATPVSFFIVLPPVQFEGGFTITVTDIWGGSKEYSTTKKNPIVRSKGLRMPAKEYIGVRPPQEGDYIDEYGVNHGQGIEIDGVVWAPVNCGYHETDFKYGKMYQWGRKYGQGYNGNLYDVNGSNVGTYSDSTVPTMEEGGVSVITGNSKSSENVFYKGTSEHDFDWAYSHDSKLWNSGTESDPVKTEYDPCPDGWRVPTCVELDALSSNGSSWTINSAGQVGYWFSGASAYTSDVPQVFFPAAGSRSYTGGDAYYRGSYGLYWSSKPNSYEAYYLGISSRRASLDYYDGRAFGHSVRCVRDDSELIPVNSVTLDKTSVTMDVGQTLAIAATITPSNANHQSVLLYSSDESILRTNSKDTFIAVSEGTVTVTAMAGMQIAECIVKVIAVKDYIDENNINHGKGILIGEVVWAPVNCGYHKNNFKYGKLYQWGRKYGQGYSGNLWAIDGHYLGDVSDASVPTIEDGGVPVVIGNDQSNSNVFYIGVSSNDYDWVDPRNDNLWNSGTDSNPIKTEYDPCPAGWRVPTYAELAELRSNRSSWITYSGGQVGCWLSGASAYTLDVSKVFFPAAGGRKYDNGTAYNRGYGGYYWSSRPYGNGAVNLSIYSNAIGMYELDRAHGCSVRCVQE